MSRTRSRSSWSGSLGRSSIAADPEASRSIGHETLSRSYGLPTAAGGMLRPTTPASTTMVTM